MCDVNSKTLQFHLFDYFGNYTHDLMVNKSLIGLGAKLIVYLFLDKP